MKVPHINFSVEGAGVIKEKVLADSVFELVVHAEPTEQEFPLEITAVVNGAVTRGDWVKELLCGPGDSNQPVKFEFQATDMPGASIRIIIGIRYRAVVVDQSVNVLDVVRFHPGLGQSLKWESQLNLNTVPQLLG